MLGIRATLGSDKKGDPLVYCDLLGRKRAILFDLGNNRLNTAQLRRVTDIFVSHTHMDHFIGFDKFLRVNLVEDHLVNIYGPPGFIANVKGKISGYLWNLPDKLGLKIKILEVRGKEIEIETLDSQKSFATTEKSCIQFDGLTLLDDEQISVKFVEMDHRTPCFSYLLEEKQYFNVRKDALDELKVKPHAWLAQLKEMASTEDYQGKRIQIDDQSFEASFLIEKLLVRKEGYRIGYITDIGFLEPNLQKAEKLFNGINLLFCESSFLHEDIDKAQRTYHLTTRQAGMIAKRCQVKKLIPFHISKRYMNVPQVLAEIRREFEAIG
jgi:ribonuclease Z